MKPRLQEALCRLTCPAGATSVSVVAAECVLLFGSCDEVRRGNRGLAYYE